VRQRFGDPQTRTVAILASCLLLAGIAFYALVRPPATSAIGSAAAATVQTNWGPLSDEDRQLLAKVKQAGLWEMPTGEQAQTKASRQSIKDVGRKINAEHMLLDQDVTRVADQLGVTLPTNPNPQQQGWMNELAGLAGDAYDKDFVLRLRMAHGKVFSVIATVRSDTGNSLIRDFASRAMVFVQRHMGYLESTGLVDYTQRLP
jgi:predicted outer membrane protein